ncbi:MAG: hypothetical protein L0332_24600 [Chloroflexi bacterium]|nr:hypothetical protein [Chloroflexota bacterium]MCI0579886.1 hypothetical protein [Chloroflexota bacterium]MCI0646167.1 hypothetical protein [Chloroflexota bacterium]MCI0729877.1 hypothetical protein [Chloroflexota bacterium]
MEANQQYAQASIKTADNLRTIAQSAMIRDLSRLSLPEVESVVDAVSRVVPAGNVPGVILNGLARLPGRRAPANVVKRDINLLFKGVETALDKAVYNAFFAGPAAVIWGYQNLLKLAGKNLDEAFPEGVWQFYVDYALREDTARHANETRGFDARLRQHNIQLNPVDRVTAWIMAAVQCLHQYNEWLANEWQERTYIYLLEEISQDRPEAGRYAAIYREWEKQRPYGRGSDAGPQDNYAAYRRLKFEQFLAQATRDLSDSLHREWQARIQAAGDDLAAYQAQMTMLAYLAPGPYGEARTPIDLAQAHVGVIHRGRYYLLPVCEPGTARPVQVTTVREQAAAILSQLTGQSAAPLSALARVKRAALCELRRGLNQTLAQSLEKLRLAPILLNTEQRPAQLPLSELRQTERGIGDHALTIFDTGKSFVFDQSHIFFDGAWGAALAEILTREALSWAVYLHRLPAPQPGITVLKPLLLPFEPTELRLVEQSPRVSPEIAAETDGVKLQPVLTLRRLFKQRNDFINLTVNDLLVLFRAIHAVTYQPDPAVIARLNELADRRETREAARTALASLRETEEIRPAILIPIDVSRRLPRDRLYPLVFEVPLHELDLLELQEQTVQALEAYEQAGGDRSDEYARFDQLQRTYLAVLAGFGDVLSKAKEIALKGESASVGTIKLLAHIPIPIQRLLDKIPGRFDVLNDLIKGREVFSNVGAVVASSSLTRFSTAKDDNEKKSLAWGVLTDAEGAMRITLRDFRYHVGPLVEAGQRQLAESITQHYLDTYAQEFNKFVLDLRRVTMASRETRMVR